MSLSHVEKYSGQGKKVHAIKELRTITGLGLKEAKYAVEAYHASGVWGNEVTSLLTSVFAQDKVDPLLITGLTVIASTMCADVQKNDLCRGIECCNCVYQDGNSEAFLKHLGKLVEMDHE